jgi:hypothetical protein
MLAVAIGITAGCDKAGKPNADYLEGIKSFFSTSASTPFE